MEEGANIAGMEEGANIAVMEEGANIAGMEDLNFVGINFQGFSKIHKICEIKVSKNIILSQISIKTWLKHGQNLRKLVPVKCTKK